jgi:predicted nuclease of restriction endonuclease-like RecB superfamily
VQLDLRIDPHCDNWKIEATCRINERLYRITTNYPAEGNHKKFGEPVTEEEAVASTLVEMALYIRGYNR